MKKNQKPKIEFKNRIVGSGSAAPTSLLPNPENCRIHTPAQEKAVAGMLKETGWVQQIIVNKRTGRLVDGHLRVALAIENGVESVPVVYVDLSEAEEKLCLAALDPLSEMALLDEAKLGEVLGAVEISDKDLAEFLGTLYSQELAGSPGPGEPGSTRALTDRDQMLKIVIFLADVALFEEAMALTGRMNRAEAVADICRHYVDANQKG